MTDPPTITDLAALGLFCCGLLWIRGGTVKTKIADTKEMTLLGFPFDGFCCRLTVQVSYQQPYFLTRDGYQQEGPVVLTEAVVVRARMMDCHKFVHSALPIELRQIQERLDQDQASRARLQRMLEKEVGE